MLVLSVLGTRAEEIKKVSVNWSAPDLKGNTLTVPDKERVSILAFVRTDQPQSTDALQQIKSTEGENAKVQVIVIFSGDEAQNQAKDFAGDASYSWPIVADPDFKSSGQLGVHVWPTTLVVNTAGDQVAHLAGLPLTFAKDLSAYVQFASNQLDGIGLQQKLTTREVVVDDAQQIAARHLQVAQRLLDDGNIDQAKDELVRGLKAQPDNAALELMMVRALLMRSQCKPALDLLEKVPPNAAPAWQIAQLRGRAFIGLEKWDDAAKVLPDALTLNPHPDEPHYLLGVVYERQKEFAKAAAEYRKAFESTSGAANLKIK
jgi:hypothetical protein